MTRIMVYGASDDLIEVVRIGRYPDEIEHIDELGGYDLSAEIPGELHFSDGSILRVWYGDGDQGIWRIEIEHQGTAAIVIVPAENDEDGIYTDTAYLTGPAIKCTQYVREGEVEEL